MVSRAVGAVAGLEGRLTAWVPDLHATLHAHVLVLAHEVLEGLGEAHGGEAAV